MNFVIPDTDVAWGALTIVGEARGEEYRGQLAVGYVIENRVQHPRWWGHDWKSVCLQDWQFSCYNEPRYGGQPFLHHVTADELISNDVYRSCLQAATYVHDTDLPDVTHGATHYVVTEWLHDPKLRPAWADELRHTVDIGRHSFFTTLEHT